MKNTLVMRLSGLVLGVLAGVNGAFADVVELPLNGCEGNYDVNTTAWTMDFDLGVTFSEISHVYIDWSGEINARLVQGMGEPEPTPISGDLDAGIGAIPGEGWLRRATVWGGASSYPAPQPFDVRSEFFLLGLGVTWNNFLDGKERITILYPSISGDPPPVYQGWAVLNNATLVVEGNIIPEPSTVVLVGIGFMQILRRKGRNKRS